MQVERLISLWRQASSSGRRNAASAYRTLLQGPRAAFVSTTIVLAVILLTGSVYQPTAYTLFLGAIILSAYHGGVYPGFLAVVLSAFYLGCLYVIPVKDAAVTTFSIIDAAASVILLSLAGLLACFLANECRSGARKLDEHLRSLDHAREGLIVLDEMLRVKHINRAAQTITGWSAQDALNRPLEGVAGLNEQQSGQAVRIPWTTLLQNGAGNTSGAAVLVSRDGGERHVDYWIEIVAAADNTKDVCFFFHDVSERRQTEERDRRLLEQHQRVADSLPVPFCFLDQANQCTLLNRSWQDLIGAMDERTMPTLAAKLTPADAQFTANWSKALRERSKYASDCQLRSGATVRHFRFESLPLRGERGENLGQVCLLIDTTPTKTTEQDLARKQQELLAVQNLLHQCETEANEHIVALEKAQEVLQQELARECDKVAALQQRLQSEAAANADLRVGLGREQEKTAEIRHDLHREQEVVVELRDELAIERELVATLRKQADALGADHQGASSKLDKLASELQNAKAALSQAVRLGDLLQTCGQVGVIRWDGKQAPSVDAAARAMLELGSGEITGRWADHVRVLHTDGQTALDDNATPFALAERRQAFGEVEVCIRTASGTARSLLATGAPVGEDKKKPSFVVMLRDSTDLRQLGADLASVRSQHDAAALAHRERVAELETQITELKEKLALKERAEHALPAERGDELLTDHPIIERALAFAGCVAEQVRELSQQLHDHSERGPAEEFRKHCQIRMLQLNVLADSLRAAVRAPEKSLQTRQPLDITRIVNHVASTWRRLLYANSRQLMVSLPAGPNWVVASSGLLCLAVEILVDVACHNSDAGAYIDLTLAGNEETATLSVTDKGRGFSPSEMSYLRGVAPTQPHTGLEALRTGIAFVEALAQVQNGELQVESGGRGKGSAFHLRLPRQGADAASTPRFERAASLVS